MKTAHRVSAYLLALSVAVQAALIAFGAFALEDNIDNGPVADGDTTGVTLHHSFAYVVLLFGAILLAVSFGAKVEHGIRWAALALGLIVAQFVLAYAAYSAPVLGRRRCPGSRPACPSRPAPPERPFGRTGRMRAPGPFPGPQPDAELDLRRRAAKGGPGGLNDEHIR